EQIFIDALSQPVLDRSTAQVNAVKLSGLAGKSLIDALKASIDRDKLSMRSFAQIESKRFGGIADTALQAHESLLDTLKERIDRSSQINPLLKEDRSIVHSPIDLGYYLKVNCSNQCRRLTL
ncbi:hypothetical protein, partial [Chamaesiphon sp. OTE_75_metabat_556]|uniref:hypothetical protein n=1 Tax=Chamaesiphon sp. OTE_75_metabat_556 TaxID=2964692 RepID=UPI00286AE96A